MIERKIYAAGPIAGLTFEESEDWRDYVKSKLSSNIHVYSPLRGKEYLKDKGRLSAIPNDSWPVLSCPKGINTRDHYDLLSCDLVLANLVGTSKVSIGTVMEIAWAYAYRKPCIVSIEEGNVHWHPMLKECAGFIVPSLDEAIDLVEVILNP